MSDDKKVESKNESQAVVTSWAGASVVFLDKLGVPAFLLIAFIGGYYFLQNDFQAKIKERDQKIENLSNSLSNLNQLQLDIAKSAMEINGSFVTSTKESFKELNSMRSTLSANLATIEKISAEVKKANVKLSDYDAMSSLNATLRATSDSLKLELQKLKVELDNERKKSTAVNVKVQELASAILSNSSSTEIRKIAKTLTNANKNLSEELISNFANDPSRLESTQGIFGLKYTDLIEIINTNEAYVEWIKVDDTIYGVRNVFANSFANILKITIKDDKVDDIDIIKELSIISGLVETSNTFAETLYLGKRDQYFLEVDELYLLDNNKNKGSLWSLTDIFNSLMGDSIEVIRTSGSQANEIKAIDYLQFNNKHKETINEDDTFLEEYLWRMKASRNRNQYASSSIAMELRDQPDKLKLFFSNAAKGKMTSGFDLDEVSVGRIGWALIAEGAELLTVEKNESLITISILYPQSLYAKEILKLEYNTQTEQLRII